MTHFAYAKPTAKYSVIEIRVPPAPVAELYTALPNGTSSIKGHVYCWGTWKGFHVIWGEFILDPVFWFRPRVSRVTMNNQHQNGWCGTYATVHGEINMLDW